MSLKDTIEERAKTICPRIIFPESDEPVILEVAVRAAEKGIVKPVLLGNREEIETMAAELNFDVKEVEVMTPEDDVKMLYARKIAEENPLMTEKMVMRKLRSPLYFAACAVHFGAADSFIAGYRYTTGEVILAASAYIGLEDGIQTVSSFNVVTVPGFKGSEGENVVFTDVAVCVSPDAVQLADIAKLTAKAVQKLLGWKPRVAFLSYSTKGSGESDSVEKVKQALAIFREKNPDILADGEFQLEVALSESAAVKKTGQAGPVAGCANIVVFPDLNAGNTNIKSVKLFASANSIGPVLTGFKAPVSDLSRTGSIEHLLGTVAAVAALCGKA